MKPSLQEMLDKIKAADETELQRVHDDFIQKGLDKRRFAPAFEVDDMVVDVPFNTLREYLQTGKATERPDMQKTPVKNGASSVFTGRIPNLDTSSEKESDYYWDKNYNYEYMNPESERQKVLGKIKK